jgi:hypothetical protein
MLFYTCSDLLHSQRWLCRISRGASAAPTEPPLPHPQRWLCRTRRGGSAAPAANTHVPTAWPRVRYSHSHEFVTNTTSSMQLTRIFLRRTQSHLCVTPRATSASLTEPPLRHSQRWLCVGHRGASASDAGNSTSAPEKYF